MNFIHNRQAHSYRNSEWHAIGLKAKSADSRKRLYRYSCTELHTTTTITTNRTNVRHSLKRKTETQKSALKVNGWKWNYVKCFWSWINKLLSIQRSAILLWFICGVALFLLLAYLQNGLSLNCLQIYLTATTSIETVESTVWIDIRALVTILCTLQMNWKFLSIETYKPNWCSIFKLCCGCDYWLLLCCSTY